MSTESDVLLYQIIRSWGNFFCAGVGGVDVYIADAVAGCTNKVIPASLGIGQILITNPARASG